MDAGVRTTVSVSANAYDKRTSGSGCSPSGCKPSLVRDGKLTSASRWSCNYDLSDEDCEICFGFDEPQDIVSMKVRLSFNWRWRVRGWRTDGVYVQDAQLITSPGTVSPSRGRINP